VRSGLPRCWGSEDRIRAAAGLAATMIEVEGLTKLYGEFVARKRTVLPHRARGSPGPGRPNGAGKTTTLRCLAGIIPPTRGSVRICGHDLARDPIPAKQQLAFFTDEPRLFDYLTVRQHPGVSRRAFTRSGITSRPRGNC